MANPVSVNIVNKEKLFVEYNNGISGEVNLDGILNHKDYDDFRDDLILEKVHIDEKTKDIVIDDKAILCKNALYGILKLKNEMLNIGIKL